MVQSRLALGTRSLVQPSWWLAMHMLVRKSPSCPRRTLVGHLAPQGRRRRGLRRRSRTSFLLIWVGLGKVGGCEFGFAWKRKSVCWCL